MESVEDSAGWKRLTAWFKAGTKIRYKKGEIIVRPEDPAYDLMLIESGSVKVYSLTNSGDENIRVFKVTGEIFPLVWLMRPYPRTSYYEAIDHVVLFRRSQADMLHFVKGDPEVALALLANFTDLYDNYADRVHNLEFRYARERIAYRLASLAKLYGSKTPDGLVIGLPVRQAELADTVNVTRETASRELQRLKKKGIIDYEDTRYVICDLKRLEGEY